jgi:hypothetical protein
VECGHVGSLLPGVLGTDFRTFAKDCATPTVTTYMGAVILHEFDYSVFSKRRRRRTDLLAQSRLILHKFVYVDCARKRTAELFLFDSLAGVGTIFRYSLRIKTRNESG